MTGRNTLIIMAKAPTIGAGKTRLAADIGKVRAATIARQLLLKTLTLAQDTRWRTVLWVADSGPAASRFWPKDMDTRRQIRGDLGERLIEAFAQSGAGPVCVIGTDAPAITPGDIDQAFRTLRRADAVLGPAVDGGFWLFGLSPARSGHRRRAERAFAKVRWSTQNAAEDVCSNVHHMTLKRLRTLTDIDDGTSYSAWATRLSNGR